MKKKDNHAPARLPRSARGEWEDAKNHQHSLKYNAIISVATRKFMERGYADTTLADIARELGITDKALYYYFRNKEDLAYQCVSSGQAWVYPHIEKCDELPVSGYEKMYRHVRYAVEQSRVAGPMMAWMPAKLARSRRGRRLRETQIRHRDMLIDWIRQGQEDGSILPGDPVVLWNLLFGALNWIPAWAGPDTVYDEALVDHALLIVERLLKA